MQRPLTSSGPPWTLIALAAVTMGFLSMLPYVVHTFSPSSAGLTVIRDKDFGNYLSRFNRALQGHPEEANDGITPIGSGVRGMQPAGMEILVASLFGWTGLSAPPLSVIVTGLFTVISFLLLFLLFQALEFERRTSLLLALLLFFVQFFSLTRVMHPGWSFVPTLLALLSFLHFWKKPSLPAALMTGMLLGLLPYLYFWSFSFAWATVLSAVVFASTARGREDPMIQRFPLLLVLGATAFLCALPFFVHTVRLFSHPLYQEITIRADILYQRAVESRPRSVLIVLQLLFLFLLFPRHKREWRYLASLSFLAGLVLAQHQNFIHGRVLMFASHYYVQMVLATLIAGAWALRHSRSSPRAESRGSGSGRAVVQSTYPDVGIALRAGVIGITAIFLAAAVYDDGGTYRFFLPRASDYRDQHLLPAIALLENGKRDIVLSDSTTGRVVTSWTDDGIIYTNHIRFLFLSDREMAERYCVSELFDPRMPDPYRALYREYNRVIDSPTMRSREQQLVSEACQRVRANPLQYLRKYEVTHVLWNRNARPAWVIDRQKYPLTQMGSGTGWTLYSIDNG